MPGRHSAPRRPRRRPRTALVVAMIGATTAAAIVAVLTFAPAIDDAAAKITGTTNAETLRDLDGNRIALDPDEHPDDTSPLVTADTGERFVVPSVKLDVPLGALTVRDGQITPPGFTRAYTVANLGVDVDHAAEGTAYVVMHSLRGGGRAPGNSLFDTATGRSRVAPGAAITVGGVTYTVTSTHTVKKGALPDDADVWRHAPDRLVVITCLQNPENRASTSNFIIEATRAGTPPLEANAAR